MAHAAAAIGGAEFDGFAQEAASGPQIVRSQAAGLLDKMNAAKPFGPLGPWHGGKAA